LGYQLRRIDQSVRENSELATEVPSGIGWIAGPAVPVQGRTIHHAGPGLACENGDLALEFFRQVDVVRVEKGNILPSGMVEAEIARRTHAEVAVALVLQIANGGATISIFPGDG